MLAIWFRHFFWTFGRLDIFRFPWILFFSGRIISLVADYA